ncbi:Small-conductance mechanosensitive channel [Planctomycetes bacterium Poly30]|uniref:Small-conductance mechanosensitive channel n=2 Tax=Saltatorellus ferox TaxID=2528018 RepID=A0A518EZR5_9BACT|nr:Small-conductance mechanosensitive channel [Planctomycetes bacterium Poly30]
MGASVRRVALLSFLVMALVLGMARDASGQAPPQDSGPSATQRAPASEGPSSERSVPAATEDAATPSPQASGLEGAKLGVEREVRSLFSDPVPTLKRWFLEDGPRVAGRLLLFLLILIIAKVLARIAGRIVRRAVARSAKNASELFKAFIENTVSNVVFILGLILALQNLGLDVAPLIAGVGVVGFIVGFALQDTLGNFAAGIMLLTYRPFDVGDFVEVAGKEGTVDSMTLVSTTLMTLDNQRLTIPNGKIWGDVIRNATANDRRRMNETVGIGYDDDIARAEAVAMEVAKSLQHVLADPEPQVLVTSLGDSSVNLSIRAWVPTKEYFGSCCELRRSVKLRFDAEGISIPYPQRDVHVRALPKRAEAVES